MADGEVLDKLLPCPRCVALWEPVLMPRRVGDDIEYQAFCYCCNFSGERKPSKEAAIRAWNELERPCSSVPPA